MRILIVLNAAAGDERPANLKKVVETALPSAQVDYLNRAFNSAEEPVGLLNKVATSPMYDLVLHHCGGSNSEYRRFVNAYLELFHDTARPVIVLFTGGGTADAESAFRDWQDICVVGYDTLEQHLALFVKALSEDDSPSWGILRGGATEAAQQILTAAWLLQLEWEASGKLPSPSVKTPETLEEKVRAYLLGSAKQQDIENDRLAGSLSKSEVTAIEALKSLTKLRTKEKGWLDWNELLTKYSRSWLGED